MEKFAFLDILKQPWMVNWKIFIYDAKNNILDQREKHNGLIQITWTIQTLLKRS